SLILSMPARIRSMLLPIIYASRGSPPTSVVVGEKILMRPVVNWQEKRERKKRRANMKRVAGINHQLSNFLDLFFPKCCAGCDRPLVQGEKNICTHCRYTLPFTDFHKDPMNEGVRLLGGQLPLETVLSYLYFDDDSRVQ